jgi:phosphoribosyl 1,2-cyclic phosphate phosphodiesterase
MTGRLTMRVTVLGSGTSAGVPTLGCSCAVCSSSDPRNKRLRSSAYIEAAGQRFIIDCGPDFRTQALAHGIRDLDFVLLTHEHADHVNGLDDLRAFNMIHGHPIGFYGPARSLSEVRRRFAYCFKPATGGSYVPQLELHEVDGDFEAGGIAMRTVPVIHGQLPIVGYRIGAFAWLTDVSALPDESYALLEGLEVLVTSALRRRAHPLHMSLDEAVMLARRVGARRTWFIHMSHDLDHETTNRTLPPNIQLAHDGLVFEVG